MSDAASDSLKEGRQEMTEWRLKNRVDNVSIFLTAVLEFLEDPSAKTRIRAVRAGQKIFWKWNDTHKTLTALAKGKEQAWAQFLASFEKHPMFPDIKRCSPFNGKLLFMVSVDSGGNVCVDFEVLRDCIGSHIHSIQRIGQKPQGAYLITMKIDKRNGIKPYRLKVAK